MQRPTKFDEAKERAAGRKAAAALRVALRSKLSSTFDKKTGKLAKSNVSARYRDGRLDRLAIVSPHYSFKQHFGSDKKGTTGSTSRKAHEVESFTRVVNGKTQTVRAHSRKDSLIASHIKGIDYKAHNHIAEALRSTNAIEVLATELGENRAVFISSQINF